MRVAPWLLALGAAVLLAPAPSVAQPVNCEWLPGTRNVTGRDAGNSRIVYVSRPRIRCDDGRYIEADSLISYEAGALHQLIGNVYFQDASQSLRSLNARYYDNLGRLEAVREEDSVKITPREAGILRWLHRHRARAVSRGELLERIWGSSGDLQTRTVDMTIANLRQKIERDPSEPRILLTVTGAGYAWGGDEEP